MGKGYPYHVIELALYFLMGCVGGVFGALFVHINSLLSRLRLVGSHLSVCLSDSLQKYNIGNDNRKRFAEIFVITLLTAWMTFTVPLIWHVCSDRPTDEEMNNYTSDEKVWSPSHLSLTLSLTHSDTRQQTRPIRLSGEAIQSSRLIVLC
jgi:hypothetical protein